MRSFVKQGEQVGKLPDIAHLLAQIGHIKHSEINQALGKLRGEVSEALQKAMPPNIASMEVHCDWERKFRQAMEAYKRFGLFEIKPQPGEIKAPDHVERRAPRIGNVIDVLKERPDLQKKIEQGFVDVFPAPIGRPASVFLNAIKHAIHYYHDQGTLRTSLGKQETLRPEVIIANNAFTGKDECSSLQYGVQQFSTHAPHRRSKQEIIEESNFEGWQVFLLENDLHIPQKGKSNKVGGRDRIEAGKSPQQYLTDLQDQETYAQEQGLSLEAWLALFLRHLHRTQGELMDERQTGALCYCLDNYSPLSNTVPQAGWHVNGGYLHISAVKPDNEDPQVGTRSAVRVL